MSTANGNLRDERAGDVFGVSGRFHNVIGNPGGKSRGNSAKGRPATDWDRAGLIVNQEWGSSCPAKTSRGWPAGSSISVSLRFDDNCANGHESFAATADIYKGGKGSLDSRWLAGGCLHEEIEAHFPKLAPLLKWHLVSTDGPMYYVANTVYLAGDRDYNKRLKGEPSSWSQVVRFGSNPVEHVLKDSFAKFLQDAATVGGPGVTELHGFDFEVLPIHHDNKPHGYQFKPKYTFGGYADKWHECPFDTEPEALQFLEALQTQNPSFHKIPTAWSDGKARELDHARSAAVWPEATDEELSVEPDELKRVLLARLPGLQAEFRADMERAGFLWPEAVTA